MKVIDFLKSECEKLELPENYYHGLCMPEKFALPDSILVFFSRFGVSEAQYHGRYQLVIPFAPVIYCVETIRYELQPGMGLLLEPWQKHNHLPGSENILCERLLITFELPCQQYYLPDSHLVELSGKAENILTELLECYREQRTVKLAWHLTELLKELSDKSIEVNEKRLSALTAHALGLIAKNIHNALDIQFLADQLDISASHLRMIFRKEMGVSIGKYISEQRMILACMQLQNSNLPIQQIAEKCGFASICAFSHFFKNKTGFSPAEFRKMQQMPE
ncbi:MAG: helix-turn-helix transcriptional regulator [Lentisphaeria bacterium]|nr:helix-turn-helix transcriptional regulator [Lentisphaeria bacterium]